MHLIFFILCFWIICTDKRYVFASPARALWSTMNRVFLAFIRHTAHLAQLRLIKRRYFPRGAVKWADSAAYLAPSELVVPPICSFYDHSNK